MVYVISGGPGFGKSVLIDGLRKLGYPVGGEIARAIIQQELETGGRLLPWKDSSGFEKLVIHERIRFFESIGEEEIAFSDRGLPDQAAFSVYKKKALSKQLKEALARNQYAKKVFLTPPWRQIYRNDLIRTETFEQAVLIHECIVNTYLEFGYEPINLPKVSPELRTAFILEAL